MVKDGWPVIAEDFSQWVVEDNFCDGMPAWDKVRAIRYTVYDRPWCVFVEIFCSRLLLIHWYLLLFSVREHNVVLGFLSEGVVVLLVHWYLLLTLTCLFFISNPVCGQILLYRMCCCTIHVCLLAYANAM